MTTAGFEEYTNKQRRRLLLRAMVTAAIKVTLLVTLYFLLPLNSSFSVKTLVGLSLAMVAVIVLIVIEYRATVSSPYPRLTAAVGMSVVIAVFVLAFSLTYYLMELSASASFNTSMSRLDALYFSTTVLTTVGFGDIAAKSEMARGVTTVQMFADLILIGVVVRALMSAIGSGLTSRPERGAHPPLATPPEAS